jgi:hypothetical protein
MPKKTIDFVDEGVTVTIPTQLSGKEIYVERKDKGSLQNYQSNQPNFTPIELVINIATFEIDEVSNQKIYVPNLNPKAKLRVRYGSTVKTAAAGRKKKLAWWNKRTRSWVDLGSKNTSSRSKKWEGYGDVVTPGWDDPPMAWGT